MPIIRAGFQGVMSSIVFPFFDAISFLAVSIAKAESRGQKVEGFYVYYWYVVVWAGKSVLTFMATVTKLNL